MKFAVLLLTFGLLWHANAFGTEPEVDYCSDAMLFHSGFSWDRSRDQVILSESSGHSILVHKDENCRYLGERVRAAYAKVSLKEVLGFTALRGCKAQTFDSTTDTLWRVEFIGNSISNSAGHNFLVGYDQKVIFPTCNVYHQPNDNVFVLTDRNFYNTELSRKRFRSNTYICLASMTTPRSRCRPAALCSSSTPMAES